MPTYLTPGVYVEEIDSGSKPLAAVSTAVAAFVGFTAKAPTDDPSDPDGVKPRLVTNWSQFEKLYGGFVAGKMLPHSVFGYFNNGGGNAYIVRIADRHMPRAALALDAGQDEDGNDNALTISAFNETKSDFEVDVVIPDDAKPGFFDLTVKSGDEELQSIRGLTLKKGADHVATKVNAESSWVTVIAPELEELVEVPVGSHDLAVAVDPIVVSDTSFAGNEIARSGIAGLTIADDVTMLIVPDLITAAKTADGVDLDMWQAVQASMIAHCQNHGDRMAILDPPPGLSSQQVGKWRTDMMYDSKFAAMYYPWLKVSNPVGSNGSKKILVPPSGHMAGIWARNDQTRGVWKAPANEVITGALNVQTNVTHGEQETLNPIGVNCIRPFGTRGIRVWGARTLSSDTSWNYINVRRLFNMIEDTILQGTQWVVFEPNDQALWQRVKRTISAFLLGLWRDGALFGASPEEAFYVKCDAETNPPDSIDLGRLVVEIGVSPVKPAEFVIFRISQWRGGAAAAE